MGFGASEVLHRRTLALGRHDPQVDLHTIPEEDAGFGVSMSEDPFNPRKPNEVVVGVRVDIDRENVDVPTGLAAASEAPHGVKAALGVLCGQVRDHPGGCGPSVGDQVPPGSTLLFVDRSQYECLLLRTETSYTIEMSSASGLLEFTECLDSLCFVE